ncbi:MAG: 23S rRNA (uridine(2552)-2'-O)-methyltransferase [Halothiobacillus sp. 24-54-40]|nr:23S rRNA (uridine(2552)-2'-O)-methyltransferase RlmE [Halothiobacillaceae bacterium]OYV47197.1 MAG: 23S rRNA (uridine(2552)-2'-O)-methyltransferase [Halothiobacillus sp. 20-53-49]OYY44315.1 MAG: 23S rRNA (uridine(2552)-2'-O)-methyltransferase [Halothiobacillus sp. 35-54-62]OYZ88431.1 MAG: 23S rRNA (uridine(2552)-2'-O)-methyltransferase [Halothiobacillus sp. 24-54-40]OZA81738.1 MAG: 23S rRNA (uridine(2552)-2'-O)-methyltransferase [Halothiobacillus sp. 39-53-45]HQS01756.1 23S rRNA (uridine(25
MARSGSSQRWLAEHFRDEYVLKAKREGYRSRAVYKLMELNERDRFLKAGQRVVDLGAAPGGWTQYAAQVIGDKGHIFALDLLPMDHFAHTTVIQGDFSSNAVLADLTARLENAPVDLVISDMAPNMSGVESVDIPRAMYLAELALDFCHQMLKPEGAFVTKLFQGIGFDAYMKLARVAFKEVSVRKPKASRPRSKEVYLVAQGHRVV